MTSSTAYYRTFLLFFLYLLYFSYFSAVNALPLPLFSDKIQVALLFLVVHLTDIACDLPS